MLFVSYGLQKSASTFCWQLTCDIAEAGGHDQQVLRGRFLPREMQDGFVRFKEIDLCELGETIPKDVLLIIKTHSPLTDDAKSLMDRGMLIASATYRDPRDAAVAVFDVSAKDRAQALNRAFADVRSIKDAIDLIAGNLLHTASWLRDSRVLPISFEDLARHPENVVTQISAHMGLSATPNQIIAPYRSGKKTIGEFNCGRSGRYIEAMTSDELSYAQERFGSCIEEFPVIMRTQVKETDAG